MKHKSNKNLLGMKISALKLALVLSLGLFLLIWPKIAVGYLFEDDFDDYDVGVSIIGQGGWSRLFQQGDYIATSTQTHTGRASVVRESYGSACLKKTGAEAPDTGYFSFWLYADEFSTSTSRTSFLISASSTGCDDGDFAKFTLKAPTSTDNLSVYGSGNGSPTNFLGLLAKDRWVLFEMRWNKTADTVGYRWDFGSWFNFDLTQDGFVNTFYWLTPVNGLLGDIYLDTIKTSEAGVCGLGYDCIFCYTEEACENNGCYWILMPFPFVWICSPFSPFIETATGTQFDFNTYYATTSQFATPTVFISKLAIATQPFLLVLSSWLENFTDIFDLAEAQIKGQQLGNAIPQARGYLDFFNSLFADLPLSEILLIYLVVLVGMIIFRIVRQIKKLIAF